MQTQVTMKRFDLGQLKAAALAIGIAASVVVGAVTYSATRHDDGVGPASSSAAQITSDTAYALEATQVEQQQAAQAGRQTLSPDEAWVIEQALVAEQANHRTGTVDSDAWRFAEINQLPLAGERGE
jgi:hypothetical protein